MEKYVRPILITGAVLGLTYCADLLLEVAPKPYSYGTWLMFIARLVLLIWMIKQVRAINRGYLRIRQGLAAGAVAGIVAAAISITFFTIYISAINPNYLEQQREVTTSRLEGIISDSDLEEVRDKLETQITPTSVAVSQLFTYPLLVGVFAGLISIRFRRLPSVFDEPEQPVASQN